jgi:hypothetical protein
MIKKISFFILFLLLILTNGCIRETYDMDKLSDKAVLSPTLAMSVFKGEVTFSDLVKNNDTVVYGSDKFVKVVIKKDSVINLELNDFYDFTDMLSYTESYEMGELKIADFQTSMNYTLDQVSQNFDAAHRNAIVALNGSTSNFPSFPSTNIGQKAFTAIPNIQNAVFASGSLDVVITNNFPAPLSGMSLNLYNTTGMSQIGSTLVIPAISAGQAYTATIDLAGKTLTSSVTAAVVLSGSAGTSYPVSIDLQNNKISFELKGRNMKVRSGRVILPEQTVSINTVDTISFNPGTGIEIQKLKVLTGDLSYTVSSTTQLNATISVTMPNVKRNGIAVSEVINVNPLTNSEGTISFNNTEADLSSDASHPFNKVPFEYNLKVSSNNSPVTFNSTDHVQFDLRLISPDFDYVKGYFGQRIENIDPEIVDLDIDDILSKLTGSFLVSSPVIKLNYSNSFAIPIEVVFNAEGKNGDRSVNLGLAPLSVNYPSAPGARDISSTFIIDKNNSSLPDLISLPPGKIDISGSAKMNPDGDPNHSRDNYVFGNSRFLGSMEVEVPLEFRFNNFQLSDTIDNFLKDEDSSFDGSDFEKIQLALTAKNGFPLGISVKLSLYDSVTRTIKSTVDATDLLKPASIDNTGKANTPAESAVNILLNSDFFNSVNSADKIIFRFTLVTSDNGTKDVKIYSDYKLSFGASFCAKPEIEF